MKSETNGDLLTDETRQVQAAPVVEVARDLTVIVELAEGLEDQAVNAANDQLMPGGLAMVALGAVSNLEAWSHKLDALERRAIKAGLPMPVIEDDDEWEPPLQSLLFWSEDLRRIHGQDFEPSVHRPHPTLVSEANFIRWQLDWMWDNEVHWDDFAKSIDAARIRLEALLSEGLRAKRGVPCLSVECNGATLIQPVATRREHRRCEGHDGVCLIPHERCPHDRGGLRDEWTCPSCDRHYSAEDYRRAVAQSAFLNAEWLTIEDAMARTGAKRGSIYGWATRGRVKRKRDAETARTMYHVDDIEACTREVVAS